MSPTRNTSPASLVARLSAMATQCVGTVFMPRFLRCLLNRSPCAARSFSLLSRRFFSIMSSASCACALPSIICAMIADEDSV